ncbi:rCG44209 [Rattus norvegicus]|jgi:hypothetical protein
MRNG